MSVGMTEEECRQYTDAALKGAEAVSDKLAKLQFSSLREDWHDALDGLCHDFNRTNFNIRYTVGRGEYPSWQWAEVNKLVRLTREVQLLLYLAEKARVLK